MACIREQRVPDYSSTPMSTDASSAPKEDLDMGSPLSGQEDDAQTGLVGEPLADGVLLKRRK